ncbi:alpha/beta hydrolase [uncultured Hoeflea sp.]|uniref:alpha/beta fold hydrolase n=1 Tax=uncultured Hoeflea sp. TaxID=538666 RepID=UPI00261D5D28|nr:alpha/beta hydrolase [uncultured Hoeflea sp.]
MQNKQVTAGVLKIEYVEYGAADGWPCILGHGFPYDAIAYQASARLLEKAGARVLTPYLRGFGGTSFLSAKTPRSGQQAALGADLLAFLDALEIERAVLGGYDWGGRAACIVAALWPERVTALVSGNSYNIQDIANAMVPSDPQMEAAYWYQYFFHSERGRMGLELNRSGFARTLWEMWSPNWKFTDEDFRASENALYNPDFVEVVIHSYRHRFGLVPGDPAYEEIELKLAAQPDINVPAICIDGSADGVSNSTLQNSQKFLNAYEYRVFNGAGHNLPQERPAEWASAVLDVKDLAENAYSNV